MLGYLAVVSSRFVARYEMPNMLGFFRVLGCTARCSVRAIWRGLGLVTVQKERKAHDEAIVNALARVGHHGDGWQCCLRGDGRHVRIGSAAGFHTPRHRNWSHRTYRRRWAGCGTGWL